MLIENGFLDNKWLCNPPMVLKLHTHAPRESRMYSIDFWVNGQGNGALVIENGFWTMTDFVMHLHVWSWNHIHLLPMHQGCTLLILGSKGQRSRSWGIGNWKWFPDHNSPFNPPMIMKLHTLALHNLKMYPVYIGSKGKSSVNHLILRVCIFIFFFKEASTLHATQSFLTELFYDNSMLILLQHKFYGDKLR